MSKSYKHLTIAHRHKIKALHKAGHSLSFIAAQTGVLKSTVSRELKRNEEIKTKAMKKVIN